MLQERFWEKKTPYGGCRGVCGGWAGFRVFVPVWVVSGCFRLFWWLVPHVEGLRRFEGWLGDGSCS